MANVIKIKNSSTASSAPSAASLEYGELAINYTDGKLYFKKSGSVVDYFSAGGGGGASAIDDLTDVTITSATTGDFLKYNGTAWVNDPIDLGTDTTGNYMANVSAGTGISISHTPSEGSTATISVNTAYAGFAPVGSVVMWSGATGASLPSGWLLCDGSEYSTSTYSTLYGVIGTRYGSGSGTFKVPDFASRFPYGITSGSPTVPRSVSGTSASPSGFGHTHAFTNPTAGNNSADHSHTITSNAGNVSADHSHGIYANTGGINSNHSHSYTKPNSGNSANTGNVNSDHSHLINLNTAGINANHNHAITSNAGNNSVSHNHTISGGSVGAANSDTHTHSTSFNATDVVFIIRYQ